MFRVLVVTHSTIVASEWRHVLNGQMAFAAAVAASEPGAIVSIHKDGLLLARCRVEPPDEEATGPTRRPG